MDNEVVPKKNLFLNERCSLISGEITSSEFSIPHIFADGIYGFTKFFDLDNF